MAERPVPIEFLYIKRAYVRHLRTGEPPNLMDLMEQTPSEFKEDFRSFIVSLYFRTGKIGMLADIDLKEIADNLIEGFLSLSPKGQLRFEGMYRGEIPPLRIIRDDSEKI